jgi:hypothetical protein
MQRRFYSKAVRAQSGCLLWIGTRNHGGYGVFWMGKDCGFNQELAHRAAWIHEKGPIPEGKIPDHLCRQRACVDTSHMELVDNQTNVLRGVGLTAINARKTHCNKGHEFTEENTYLARNRRYCRTCAKARKR